MKEGDLVGYEFDTYYSMWWTPYIGIALPEETYKRVISNLNGYHEESVKLFYALKKIADADLSVYNAKELQQIAKETIKE